MKYHLVIIDDFLDGISSGDDNHFRENRESSPAGSIERREKYDALINAIKKDANADVQVRFFGFRATQSTIEDFAKISECDLIIMDEDLSAMFKETISEDDLKSPVELAKDILKLLLKINNNFYKTHGKLPPIIRVTGRDGDETLKAKTFVSLQRRLSDMLHEFNCQYSPTHFFNVMLVKRNNVFELTNEGLLFKDTAINEMRVFYNYRHSATQPAVLLTYVNDKEKEGVIKSLTNEEFINTHTIPSDFFSNCTQNIIFEKWEKQVNSACLAVYLLSAGPGVGAFLKKTLSFLVTDKRNPVSISCIICTGVAFAAKNLGETNVVISKSIIDADMERYEECGRLPDGSREKVNNDLKNEFLLTAKQISLIKADDVDVASADKLLRASGEVINLNNRYPTAKAGEMEARGLIHLAFGSDPLVKYGIMIKGISDKGDENKNDKIQSEVAEKAVNVILKTISDESFILKYLS